MNEVEQIHRNRNDLKSSIYLRSPRCAVRVGCGNVTWEDAVVDCRIELSCDSFEVNNTLRGTLRLNDTGAKHSSHSSFTKDHFSHDKGLDDDVMYLPTSNGLHSSHRASHELRHNRKNESNSGRCFSQISKRTNVELLIPNRTAESWRASPLNSLTDKAIVSKFTNYLVTETEFQDYDHSFAHCSDETLSKTIKESHIPSTPLRGDWSPRDIKMCSPFKACRGDVPKAHKAGGPIYGDGLNSESIRKMDPSLPLEGFFTVTADMDSDEDVESYERLYKAELDLFNERGEHVDLQELDEWLYQAGLTATQIKNHNMSFRRLLKLNCKYFGRRIYPYRGELDAPTSKPFRDSNLHSATFGTGAAVTKEDNRGTADFKENYYVDLISAEKTCDIRPSTPTSIATTPSTYRIVDYATEPQFLQNVPVEFGESTVMHSHEVNDIDGFTYCPSIGVRHAVLDCRTMNCADDLFKVYRQKLSSPVESSKDNLPQADATSMNQSNFILKVLLRFPYLELRELGWTNF
ncbi:uncharacterized protein BXIN_2081 [Babesia sp. Xinjiang]|uniref:uncharacterized protein n=1 Tax=Babesia sp. Xinjiang TaxID=462227 RepID=UPI000A215BAD|nr:uncharacterized protein BXIN_2081 [Babesia sp. Xinjiang]ORM40412.1 hypothetical protein BXIN_2081 [Babesia sp. Xinjiang]